MKDNKMQITKNESLSKVDEKFCELKNNKKLALMPFIMAGDPNIEITSEILLNLQENGADLIELGIPIQSGQLHLLVTLIRSQTLFQYLDPQPL